MLAISPHLHRITYGLAFSFILSYLFGPYHLFLYSFEHFEVTCYFNSEGRFHIYSDKHGGKGGKLHLSTELNL